MNPATKKNKGFAFLRYATVEQARRAVSELKNPLVGFKIDYFMFLLYPFHM
jgi:RNA recognition motif-containing protein